MSAETTTALSELLESSSLAVDTYSDVDYPAFVRCETEPALFFMHGNTMDFIAMKSHLHATKSSNCLDSYMKPFT